MTDQRDIPREELDPARKRALTSVWAAVRDGELTTWTDAIGVVESVLVDVDFDAIRAERDALRERIANAYNQGYVDGAKAALAGTQEPGACDDPECPVLHADPRNPIHPPVDPDQQGT